MELTKADKKYVHLMLSNIKSEHPFPKTSKTNKQLLKEVIKYLSRLNRQNLINAKQLHNLISVACANYIENEVELKIENSINNKLMHVFGKI